MSALAIERWVAIMSDGQPLDETLYHSEGEAIEAAKREIANHRRSIMFSPPELRRIVKVTIPGVVEAGRENDLTAMAGALS